MTAARKPKLSVVEDRPKDITALLHAEIAARDWAAMHVAADKRGPVFLPDRVKRPWRR